VFLPSLDNELVFVDDAINCSVWFNALLHKVDSFDIEANVVADKFLLEAAANFDFRREETSRGREHLAFGGLQVEVGGEQGGVQFDALEVVQGPPIEAEADLELAVELRQHVVLSHLNVETLVLNLPEVQVLEADLIGLTLGFLVISALHEELRALTDHLGVGAAAHAEVLL